MVEQRDLYLTARDLKNAYKDLDNMKHQTRRARGERVMRPRPGPQTPASIQILSLDADCASRLQQMVYNASQDIQAPVVATQDGQQLCQWIINHLAQVAALPWADDLLDEMTTQEERILRHTQPTAITPKAREALTHAEHRYTAADTAALVTAATGIPVDRKQVTYWGRSRDHITVELGDDGHATYNLHEVATEARGDTPQQNQAHYPPI